MGSANNFHGFVVPANAWIRHLATLLDQSLDFASIKFGMRILSSLIVRLVRTLVLCLASSLATIPQTDFRGSSRATGACLQASSLRGLMRSQGVSRLRVYGPFSCPAILYKNKRFTPLSLAVKNLRTSLVSLDVQKQRFLLSTRYGSRVKKVCSADSSKIHPPPRNRLQRGDASRRGE